MNNLVKKIFFQFFYLFKGVPFEIEGKKIRLDESLRRWNVITEKELQEALINNIKNGDVIVDVGANFGLHTLLAGKILGDRGHIYAIEPIPSNIKLLKRNIRLNHFNSRITIIEAALSNSNDAYIEMSLPKEDVVVSASIAKVGNKVIKVKNMRLDDFIEGTGIKPNLIKIDVEGAEYEVLKGAENVLKKYMPILLVEIHTFALESFGASNDELIKFLQKFGYEQKILGNTLGKQGEYYHSIFFSNSKQ